MKTFRISFWVMAALVWAFVAPLAWAQPDGPRPQGGFGRGGNLAELAANQKSVQEELKLSAEQVDGLKKVSDEVNAQWREMREKQRDLSEESRRQKRMEMAEATEKKISGIISPEQLKRLKQVSYQVMGSQMGSGTGAFRNPQVAAALELTEAQKESISTITRETEQSMGGLADLAKSGNPGAAIKEYTKLRELAQEKAIAVLTPEQQVKWTEMLGEKFNGEIVMPTDIPTRGRGRKGNN